MYNTINTVISSSWLQQNYPHFKDQQNYQKLVHWYYIKIIILLLQYPIQLMLCMLNFVLTCKSNSTCRFQKKMLNKITDLLLDYNIKFLRSLHITGQVHHLNSYAVLVHLYIVAILVLFTFKFGNFLQKYCHLGRCYIGEFTYTKTY